MRTIIRRNHRNQPCKSPSPDLAAKNIIKNTTIEVEDIRSKMKKAQQKQIKFDLESSISQMSPSDNLSMENKYKQVYDEFTKLKYENKLLADQNRLLNQENQRLNLQQERNKSLNQLNSLLLSKNQNQVLRDKIVILDQEKKRLQRQLINEREKSEQSFKNIQKLRLQLLLCKDSKGSLRAAPGVNDQESRFILLSNSILSDSEQKMNRKLQELNYRINRIEMMEKIIKEQHSRLIADSRINKTPSSVKSYNLGNNTTVKNESRYKQIPQTQQRSEKEALPLSSSPIQKHYRLDESLLEKLEQENINLAQQLRIKDSEIERMKIEKQKMSAMIHDFQIEKKSYKISTPKFNTSEDNIFKKLANLEESVAHFQNLSQRYQSENSQLHHELSSFKNATQIQKRQYVNKIEYLQKIIKFYDEKQRQTSCQQCLKKEEQILNLKEKAKKAEDKFNQSLNQLQKKFQSDIDDYQRKLEHSESQGSERFHSLDQENKKAKQLNNELILELSNYKMMLEFIKDKIQAQQFGEYLRQNSSIYHEVETTFYEEREQYDKCISGFKQKLLQKQQKIIELQSQISLKIKQNELIRLQIQKLKTINYELQDNNLGILKNNLKFMGRERSSGSKKFDENSEKMMELIRSGQMKLDILCQKVSNSINYDFQSKKY